MPERLEQLNLRVPEPAADLFQAAVFVRDLRSIQDLLRPVLEAYADELAKDDAVRAAVALRQQHREKSRDNVRELATVTKKRPHAAD